MKILVSEELYNKINEREQDVNFIQLANIAFMDIIKKLKELTQDGSKSFEQIKYDVNDYYSDVYIRKNSVVVFYNLPQGTLKDNSIIIRIVNSKVSTLGSASPKSNSITLYAHRNNFEEFVINIHSIFDSRESTFVHELGHLIDYNKSDKIFRRYKTAIKSPNEYEYKSTEIYKRAVERYNKLSGAIEKRFNQYKRQNAETSVVYYQSLYEWYKMAMEDYEDRLKDWDDEKDFYLNEYSEVLGYDVSEEEGFKYYQSSNPYLCDIEWVSKMVYNDYVQNVGYNINKNQDLTVLSTREKTIRSRIYTFFSKLAEKLGVDCSKKINWDD
jgi:hypothetical protein